MGVKRRTQIARAERLPGVGFQPNLFGKLTLRQNFTDGSGETFTPDGAIGAQIQPSQIKGFPFSRTTAKQGSTVDIVEFQVHPAGTGKADFSPLRMPSASAAIRRQVPGE